MDCEFVFLAISILITTHLQVRYFYMFRFCSSLPCSHQRGYIKPVPRSWSYLQFLQKLTGLVFRYKKISYAGKTLKSTLYLVYGTYLVLSWVIIVFFPFPDYSSLDGVEITFCFWLSHWAKVVDISCSVSVCWINTLKDKNGYRSLCITKIKHCLNS